MRTEQRKWTAASGWTPAPAQTLGASAQLAVVFGATPLLEAPESAAAIKELFPAARVLGCSTAGEICGTEVCDDSMVVTAVQFEHTHFRGARVNLGEVADSFQAGERLAQSLPATVTGPAPGATEKLAHVLVLSDGLKVNGSDLVRGLTKHLPEGITVTGGLAGDGERFSRTLVCWDGAPARDTVAVLGLYGSRLRVGFGSLGGWDPFGPERLMAASNWPVCNLAGTYAWTMGLVEDYLRKHHASAAGLVLGENAARIYLRRRPETTREPGPETRLGTPTGSSPSSS